jgi:hypothetical protein
MVRGKKARVAMSDIENAAVPVRGQSHWCEGRASTRLGSHIYYRSCRNVVRNNSDHCAAGHENKIRVSGPNAVSGDPAALIDAPQESGSLSVDDISGPTGSSPISVPWTLEEARQHGIVERLLERCSAYANGETCSERGVAVEDMCERCIAAFEIERLRGDLALSYDGYDSEPEVQPANDLLDEHACICPNCGTVVPLNWAEDGYACSNCFWECETPD